MRNPLLKQKEPNHLNFFGIRRAKVPPPYFEYIQLPQRYNLEKSIVKWVETNMKGRFYVGNSLTLKKDSDTKMVHTVLKVGFEEPKELSYFTLACPLLKYN